MNRSVVLGVGAATLVAALAVTWIHVRQQREFRRLLATGDVALAHGQTSVAVEAFSGAIALEHDSMLAYLRRGDTYRRRGELDAALRDLHQAEALDRTAPQPAELLGDVTAMLGRYDQAATAYRRYLSLDDSASRVFYKLATVYYRSGQTSSAIDAVQRSIALDAAAGEPHYLLGLCFRDARRYDDAIREENAAIAHGGPIADAREALADMYAAAGHRREQIAQLQALAALEPATPERLVHVGLAYHRLGLTTAALSTLQRASARYPDSPATATALGRVWLDVAEVHQDRSALAHAIDVLEPVASRDDASSDTLTAYGRALLFSGDARAAEAVLTRAVGRTPIDSAAYTYLASASRRLGHRSLAREAAENYAAIH
jgi:tetratricopeptide (TPR) repeat protein